MRASNREVIEWRLSKVTEIPMRRPPWLWYFRDELTEMSSTKSLKWMSPYCSRQSHWWTKSVSRHRLPRGWNSQELTASSCLRTSETRMKTAWSLARPSWHLVISSRRAMCNDSSIEASIEDLFLYGAELIEMSNLVLFVNDHWCVCNTEREYMMTKVMSVDDDE